MFPQSCGDGVVNQESEQCDGSADSICPGACRVDCTCAAIVIPGTIEADVSVRVANASDNFGASAQLWVDADTAKRTFVRASVSGIGGRHVDKAFLRLQVEGSRASGSASGGRIYAITTCDWDELSMTWMNQPVIDGAVLDEVGVVAKRDVVPFDVTAVVVADGTYCFALDSLSDDGVTYNSREALMGWPELLVTLPVCGDNNINQPTEGCDGSDAPRCPGACQADCTCAPPVCGDNHVNQPAEDCDGADATACPGRCLIDCTCDTALPVGVVEADVSVRETEPDENFGANTLLSVDADSVKHAFFRVRVRGLGNQPPLAATLYLQVGGETSSASDSGGRIRQVSACAWDELTMTFGSAPAIDGPVLDEMAGMQTGKTAAFDVTAAITGDGTYCFGLESTSSDGVEYVSHEALGGRPVLDVVALGVCGDGRVNQPSEACDGIDDATCLASCLTDCICAICGDGVAEAPGESCDGADDTACSGACGIDCTCPFAPRPPFACLAQSGPRITLTGAVFEAYRNARLEAGTKIDARAATLVAFPNNVHPVSLEGAAGVCFSGGTILGQYDRTLSWKEMHDIFNNAGIAFMNAEATVDGSRIDDMDDGIRPRDGGGFTIRNVWLSYIRDDCVENDHLQAGLVDDSFLDGCYVGFSTRPSPSSIDAGFDGSDKLWTIQNSLVRLEAMPGPDGGRPTDLGHGGFFKWHQWDDPSISLSPKLALYNNVFMAEQAGVVGGSRMGTPPDQVIDCANNVMVWLGPGAFPGELPSCFTVTSERSVWDAAVADWLARHPHVGW